MLHNEPVSITDCIAETSAVRLSSYRIFFSVNDEAAFAIYKWNEEISSRLMQLVGVIEVTLRNRIHFAMSEALQVNCVGTKNNNDWFNRALLNKITRSKIDKVLKNNRGVLKNPPPTPNFVVSKMTYGFWPNILKIDQKSDKSRIEWEKLFPDIFPGLPKQTNTFWKKIKNRETVIARCFSVGELRNRIAHFEPIWKFGPEVEEKIPKPGVTPAIINPKPKNRTEAIARLSMEIDRAIELLKWLSPNSHQDYLNSEVKRSLDWLITENAIEAFVRHKEINKIAFNKAIKARRIKRLSEGLKGCSVITIKKQPIGVLFLYP